MYLNMPAMKHAAVFASTTSYLSKASFNFTTNNFVIGKIDDDHAIRIEQCVVPCCKDPGNSGCACSSEKCPNTAQSAVPGMFKYSIMAASYDFPSYNGSAYKSGAGGNGWEKVVSTYGTGSPKELKDVSMQVYQLLDFTNMAADTLTVTDLGGTAVKYKDMGTCDLVANGSCNDAYAVASMKVESGTWAADYAFPQLSNVGSWTNGSETTTVQATRKVQIHCVKPGASTMVAWGMAPNPTAAAKKKIVLVRYLFDISEITATATTGKWMNYDPTVSTASGSNSDKNTGGNPQGTTSIAPRMPVPYGFVALLAAVSGIAVM